MARPRNSKTEMPIPDGSGDDIHAARYRLEFELARLGTYHGSEGAFYSIMGRAVFVLSFLAGASAVVTILSTFYAAFITLTLVTAILAATNHAIDFKAMAKFHFDRQSQYSRWRTELDNRRDDLDWIRRTEHAMHKLWDESDYSVHYAVEAMSWNDAFIQTRPSDSVKSSDLFEIWTI
jgi:hypothetical protein